MELSIVIPTYNRKDILRKCLRALLHNSTEAAHEVLVVDDGSTDGTVCIVHEFAAVSHVCIHYVEQCHKGPAAARNLGIRKAKGEIVLFVGDDIIASPDLLAEHLTWHRTYPDPHVAVLGHVTWSPDIEITPFMKWLENGGPQFKYWSIKDTHNVSWRHLYTANVSLKRRFLLENGLFDESFPHAAYEDTELGHRLAAKGLRIVYEPKAVGYHYHFTTVRDALRKAEQTGESMAIYRDRVGDSESTPRYHTPWRTAALLLVRVTFEHLGGLIERRLVMHRIYSYAVRAARHGGYERAYRRMRREQLRVSSSNCDREAPGAKY